MKLFKKVLAVVVSMALLTACSGGGGGGGGADGGGTPIAPATFSSTKTCKLAQEGKGKNLYMEFWTASTDETGTLVQSKEMIIKEGVSNSGTYADTYAHNTLGTTSLIANGKSYLVCYSGTDAYDYCVQVAAIGGAEVPTGKNIYTDSKRVYQETYEKPENTGSKNNVIDLSESNVTTEIGTYTMPGTSVKYYAEIFTSKTNPEQKITCAYDDNDNLKAVIEVIGDYTSAKFFNQFEYGSSMFKPEKLNIASYNAMDITDAYIQGLKNIK